MGLDYMFYKKLWFRISVMFTVVIIPVIGFVYWAYVYYSNSLFNKSIQVSRHAFQNTVNGINSSISEIQGFYDKVLFSDSDIIQFPLLDENTIEYELGKQRILKKLRVYLLNVKNMDSMFMYSPANDGLFILAKDSSEKKLEWIHKELLSSYDENETLKYKWVLVCFEEKIYLKKILPIESNIEVGILIDAKRLTSDFTNVEHSFVFDKTGTFLFGHKASPAIHEKIGEQIRAQNGENDEIEQNIKANRIDYVMFSQRIVGTDVYLVTLIERNLLYDSRFVRSIFTILGVLS